MRRLLPLTVSMLCVFVSLVGCDTAMQKPIMEIVKPPQDSLEMDSLEKAQAAMEKVNERRTETQQTAQETDDFSTVFAASEDIFKEELGFRKGLWVDLVDIYRQENLEDTARLEGLENLEDAFVEKVQEGTLGMFYFIYISSFDGLIVEYLRLAYEFPEKTEEERLMLFRESVRGGEIAIIFP